MSSIEKLLEVMAKLRDREGGCPWDLRQDFSTVAPYTLEEAYEVADAIARQDLPGLRGELGDLLFQVVFHARMAEEAGAFDFEDVAAGIVEKMVRRHPHVFGTPAERRRGAVSGSWERIKAEERREVAAAGSTGGILDGVAQALPALRRAQKLGKRAAGAGFDWPDGDGPRAKVLEELEELDEARRSEDAARTTEELGDLLFAIVNLARHLDVDAEQALTAANRKFERRFRAMEAAIMAEGRQLADLPLEVLERYWQQAKEREQG